MTTSAFQYTARALFERDRFIFALLLAVEVSRSVFYMFMFYRVMFVLSRIPGALINPIALRMAKTQLSFGHSECSRVHPVDFEK